MTTIRATCPRCGEVEMGATAVRLTVESGKSEGSYSFVCPSCEDTIEKYADRKVVMLLLSAGVEVHEVEQMAFAMEEADGKAKRSRHPAGAARREPDDDLPPLTIDHLIDLHFLLQRDDWLDELIAAHE